MRDLRILAASSFSAFLTSCATPLPASMPSEVSICDLAENRTLADKTIVLRTTYLTDQYHFSMYLDDACPKVRIEPWDSKIYRSRTESDAFDRALAADSWSFDSGPSRFRVVVVGTFHNKRHHRWTGTFVIDRVESFENLRQAGSVKQ